MKETWFFAWVDELHATVRTVYAADEYSAAKLYASSFQALVGRGTVVRVQEMCADGAFRIVAEYSVEKML